MYIYICIYIYVNMLIAFCCMKLSPAGEFFFQAELQEGGKDIEVTFENREEYVRRRIFLELHVEHSTGGLLRGWNCEDSLR